MNKEQDYASDSDESDEDFCLENEADADSGEEEEDDSESEFDDENDAESSEKPSKAAKGKKKDKVKQKLIETDSGAGATRSTRQTEAKQNGREVAEKDELESDEEADKSRSDALWADFLGDVGASSKPATKPKETPSPAKPTDSGKRTAPAAKQVTEVLDFAGEKVTVTKTITSSSSSSSAKENQEQPASVSPKSPAPRAFGAAKRPANGGGGGGGGGLGSLLNQLGKKKKMSVLEKSQLDWKSFKCDEGIDEDLRTHNKGKDGYLERQDFLQRTDVRQFEIEKSLRQTRRTN
ncbi:craniofacial development protein 1 [Drosophila montana]|uniref:craniofacial development protein 1 n=1 Tax=Drosophila montana TaxID=40370 RepID=UPI00313F0DF6